MPSKQRMTPVAVFTGRQRESIFQNASGGSTIGDQAFLIQSLLTVGIAGQVANDGSWRTKGTLNFYYNYFTCEPISDVPRSRPRVCRYDQPLIAKNG